MPAEIQPRTNYPQSVIRAPSSLGVLTTKLCFCSFPCEPASRSIRPHISSRRGVSNLCNKLQRWVFSHSDKYSCCKFSQLPLPVSEGTILCNTATGVPRPLVPEQHRRSVFDALHSLLHPGVAASVKLITTRFFWPNMRRIITNWVRACLRCQRAKVQRHVREPLNFPYLGPFKILSRAEKHFKLDMNGRTEIVSVDRLKKAHFECDTTDLNVVDTPNFNPLQSPLHTPTPSPSPSPPPTPDPPPQTEKLYKTKSGRTVHCPKKLPRTHFI